MIILAYIVPGRIPENCKRCTFSVLKYCHPDYEGDTPGTIGLVCKFDEKVREFYISNNIPQFRPIDCPLKEAE